MTRHEKRTPNTRLKSTDDIRSWNKPKVEKIKFVITADFITRHAKELYNEGEGREAMIFLASSLGMAPTEAMRVCKGDYVLYDIGDGTIGMKSNFRVRESESSMGFILDDIAAGKVFRADAQGLKASCAKAVELVKNEQDDYRSYMIDELSK